MKAYRRPAAKPVGKPAATAPKPPRRGRWLRRLAIFVALLPVLGFVGFWWFAYWPFEGKVDRVESLVPADVNFLYRTSWAELKAAGWVRHNVVDVPIHPSLDPKQIVVSDTAREGRQTLQQALDEIPLREAEINDSIPGPLRALEGIVFGTKEFRVEKDLLGGEVVAAGRWCAGGSPADGPPRWRELLVLTRVTPLVKFAFEAVKHDFVRERAVARPDLELTVTSDGLLRVELAQSGPARKRQTCEGGYEMGPMNVWYAARVKDVIAVTNSEDLALKVLEVASGGGERAIDRSGFDLERPEASIAASLDLAPLRSYLVRMFSGDQASKFSAFLGKFLAVDALVDASATVVPRDDGLVVRADVRYSDARLREFRDVAATYELDPAPVADGVLRLLPAQDTAIVAQVRTPPRALLGALFDSLSKDDQRIVANHVRDVAAQRRDARKKGYDDVGQFLDELAAQLGSTTAIAVARIPSVFDKAKYAEWFLNEDPTPTAILAVIVKVRDGARQEEVEEFLADRAGALGFNAPVRVTSPEGIEYSRLRMGVVPADYELVEPGFKVHDGYLILCTREEYLLRILEVMRGGKDAPLSVAASPEFRAAMGSLPSSATVAAYANGANLRALAWDYRNKVVRDSHDEGLHERSFRAQRMAAYGRESPDGKINITPELSKRLQDEVSVEMKRFRTDGYTQFIAEYRADLDRMKRVGAIGAVLSAHRGDSRIETGVRLVLTPAGGP